MNGGPASSGARPRVIDWPVALLLVGGVVLYAGWTAFVISTNRPLDYYAYAVAAYGFSHGENVFSASASEYESLAAQMGIVGHVPPYRYPLLTALLVWPLMLTPLQVGAALWVFASGLAVLASALLLAAQVDASWKRYLILGLAVAYVPALTTMHAGQVNAFVLLSIAAAIHLWRRNHVAATGALLAVGFWLKLFTAALLGLLAWRGRWWALLSAAAISAAVTALGLVGFGVEAVKAQAAVFVLMTGPGGEWSLFPVGESASSLVGRLLLASDCCRSLAQSAETAVVVHLMLVAAFGGVTLVLLWPPGPSRTPPELEVALLVITTHLLSPLTHYHHLLTALIAFAVLIEHTEDWRKPGWEGVALAAAYVFINVYGLFWKQFSGTFLLQNLAIWGELLLWLLLAVQLARSRARRISSDSVVSAPRVNQPEA